MHALRLFTGILILFASSKTQSGVSSPDEFVRLDVRPASTVMHPGAGGEIEFRFYPADGIHVNADPPVEFSLDPTVLSLRLKGKPIMTTDPNTGYLSATVPVKQKIAFHRNVAPGSLTVKGTVKYFFCSDSEGWCNRRKQPVEFTIMVKP